MKPNAVRFIQEGLACAARDKRLLCDFSPFNFFVFFEIDPRNCIWANWEPWSCPEDGCLGVVSKLVTRNRQKRVVERYDGYCNGSPSENELCRKHCPSNLLQFNFNSHLNWILIKFHISLKILYIWHIAHCKLSDWVEWSSCSESCDTGSRNRSRSILVSPHNEGKQCGPTFETTDCNEHPCPGNQLSW